ncbi:MAG: hypothetical protein H0T76_26740 [Nannocystis sp.]|nr:hypothetical protein [Nannocystis sp.]MBA3550093.1 hypothetical protein [Nannocystis sp.]
MTPRILASAFTALLLPATILGGLSLASAEVRAEVKAVACKVTVFLATKDGDGSISPELKFLEEQLRDDQFAAFKGFRLLEAKTLKLGLDKPSVAALQSGFQLRLNLLGEEASKLKLHANLMAPDRDKPLVDTAYKIDNNGLLLVGGVRHLDGKVFFAIQCRGET